MNERDLRTAFDQLKADVGAKVQTEERLQRLTERRVWLRAPLVAAASAAAVAIIVGGALLALRPAPDPVPPATGGPSSTEATVGPTTLPPTSAVPAPTTLPSTTAVPTSGTRHLPAGTVLVADPGATTTASDGVVVVDADRVVGDGVGGLVVQRADTISRVAADGAETVLLDPSTVVEGSFWGGDPRLEDVVLVDGAPQAVVVITFESQEIWLLDLDSGATISVFRMDAADGNITRVSAVAGRMVLSVLLEGGAFFEYLDIAGQPIDVVGPYYTDPNGYAESPTFIDQAVLSPDGATLVYLEIDYTGWLVLNERGRIAGHLVVDIVAWDLDRGTETSRLRIEFPADMRPGRLDYDGASVVLGRYEGIGPEMLAPLRISPLGAGVITELESAGMPSLVK